MHIYQCAIAAVKEFCNKCHEPKFFSVSGLECLETMFQSSYQSRTLPDISEIPDSPDSPDIPDNYVLIDPKVV